MKRLTMILDLLLAGDLEKRQKKNSVMSYGEVASRKLLKTL